MVSAPSLAALPAAPETLAAQAASPQAGTRASTSAPAAAQPSHPNPALSLNATLGLVVLEFRGADGDITESIPSQQQIAAYQTWITTGQGSDPLQSEASAQAAGNA
jgi:hypothetical protein